MKLYLFVCFLIAKSFVILTKITSFYYVSLYISKISFKYGEKIRFYYYKSMLLQLGHNVLFSRGCVFSHNNISIGDNVRFGLNNTIGLVDFGCNIIIAQNVDFLSGSQQHRFESKRLPIIDQPGVLKRIKIENNVWIGAKCVIMSSINKNSIIGSGAILTKTYSANSILAGNPARKIKNW